MQAPDAPAIESVKIQKALGYIEIKWLAPNTNGAVIEGYTLKIEQRLGQIWHEQDCGGLELECHIPFSKLYSAPFNLRLGDTLKFKVLASSDQGDGPYQNGQILFAFEPLAPIEVRDSGSDQTQIGVAWDAPDAQGSPITGYTVRYREIGSVEVTEV